MMNFLHRITILTLLILGVASASLGEGVWKLKVHRGDDVEEFNLVDIDSLTFHQEPFAVPSLVIVPAGEFLMGDGVANCGLVVRLVNLTRDFEIGRYEITNQQYLIALQWAYDRGYITASATEVRDNLDGGNEELLDLIDEHCEIQFSDGVFSLRDAGYGLNPDHPAIEVRWFGAARYCDWLSLQEGLPRAYEHAGDWSCNGGDPYGAQGYRLPTDAEWEYAARYDDGRIYPWGNQEPDCAMANFAPGETPCLGWGREVGSYPAAPEALQLFDMSGNAFEWCNDWHVCDLGVASHVDPTGPPTGDRRVLRGGGWICDTPFIRCADRNDFAPTGGSSHVGFRIARTVQ